MGKAKRKPSALEDDLGGELTLEPQIKDRKWKRELWLVSEDEHRSSRGRHGKD